MNEASQLTREERSHIRDEIARISSHIDAATHRLLTLIRTWDASDAWADEGALSCAHWLTWRIGISVGTARAYVRVANALADLPKVDEALRLGQISYSKVRAITRVATPENEDTLLQLALHGTGAQLEKAVAKYRRVLRVGGYIPVDDPEFRFVRKSQTSSGMVRITAQLLPEEAEIVTKALEAARRHVSKEKRDDVSAETSGSSPAQPLDANDEDLGERLERERRSGADRVDGLLWLAESVLSGNVSDVGSSPVEVLVHTEDPETAPEPTALIEASIEDGRVLEPETAERLLCDAATVEVSIDPHGNPLDIGRRTRRIPPALKRALLSRDAGCRFPGCDRTRTDGHHIVPWSEGGATSLENLVSLCRRHHRFVHEGWRQIEIREGNEILFYDPRGGLIEPTSLRSMVTDDAMERLIQDRADEGIDIDAFTSAPRSMDNTISWDQTIQDLMADFRRSEARRTDSGDVSAETS